MATLRTLVTTARTNRRGRALASDGRWKAVRHHDGVHVYHYTTEMILITPENDIIAINEGWGSMTDKKGVREIARGVGIFTSYNEIFSIAPKTKGTRGVSAEATQKWARVFDRVRERQAFLNSQPSE
jgi:hypothetical protein